MMLIRAFAVCVLAAASLGIAYANGAPIRIQLSKLAGVVTVGTNPASGFAEITAVEGDVVVMTDGLPRLTNELYQSWLVNSRTGERVSVGKFNVTAEGTSRTHSIVAIGNREFNLFVITVEPEPDPNIEADSRIVLAGYWPGKEPVGAQAAAQATARAQGTPIAGTPIATLTAAPPLVTLPAGVSIQPPLTLPRTGDPGFGALAVFAIVMLGAAFVAGSGRR
ncbi:MAG: anti-sigma factor [Chloroflexi bacterium]|nr:anti-sigma factor [Chloroflexota bacterium]